MAKVKAKPKRQRVNMRLPTDLVEWARLYALKKNTSVTQILVDHLTHLREKHS